MSTLNVNISQTIARRVGFVTQDNIFDFHSEILAHYACLKAQTGKGNEFLGWQTLPTDITEDQIQKIESVASRIQQTAEILVVIGIGGSYLGARAVIDALSNHFATMLSSQERKKPLVVYAGQNICADYLSDLRAMLQNKSYAIAVISKSGTTTEPALAFRMLKKDLEDRYGKEGTKSRIIAITDARKGALRTLAQQESYETFEIADNVGGRFSVLTPVGLLPIAVAGFDIRQLLEGARVMQNIANTETDLEKNPVSMYAAVRNALYQKGKKIELLASYHPRLQYFTEWWKQLYGESEGKNGKGIFPANVNFTTDLHSMGQMIQDGERSIFETIISVQSPTQDIEITKEPANLDNLNYLAGKTIGQVNKMAEKGTMLAHVEGGVPNIRIEIPQITAHSLGQLIYFFEKACALSGYILNVNPFDQPGVEAYKTNMFALLGKAGFEDKTAKLLTQLGES